MPIIDSIPIIMEYFIIFVFMIVFIYILLLLIYSTRNPLDDEIKENKIKKIKIGKNNINDY